MAKIDSAYDYYMANYASNEVSRYDSHKKSDLRRITNRIVKNNKESPLYKINSADEAKELAIDIKQNAKDLQNVVASLSDKYGTYEDSFQKKVAFSSDEDKVSVEYVGDGSEENNADSFDIHVDSLAMPQVNIGKFLDNDSRDLLAGSYSFDLTTPSNAYEFQYNVSTDDNNKDVLEKLANLVNNSKLSINAQVISDEANNTSALSLTSRQTGLSDEESFLFSISPGTSSASISAMNTLGINKTSSPASNSSFTINGQAHSSLSNTFTINNAFEITLKERNSPEESTTIGFKANVDAIADNIQQLADSYNSLIDTAEKYQGTEVSTGNKLLNDVSSISKNKQASLEYIGLMVDEDGKISIDRDVLSSAITPGRNEQTFNTLSDLKDSMGEKADEIAINPMNYVNKVVVAYKNPGHNFNTPYISSIYSGMMMDDFI